MEGFTEMSIDNYNYGYRNGHADHRLGLPMLTVAITCPDRNLPDYARGYYDGYHGFEREPSKVGQHANNN